MRLDISKYNIISDLDKWGLIGYVENMIKLYKDYIKQLTDDIQDDVMCDDLKCEIDLILNLVHDLYALRSNKSIYTLVYVEKCDTGYKFKVIM